MMKEFKPLDSNVEVLGEATLSIVNSFPEFMRGIGMDMLEKDGISNPEPGHWYKQSDLMDCLSEIDQEFGGNTLFEIGKAVPENAQFPPGITNLFDALEVINTAYQMNHRNGEIGFYKVVERNDAENTIVMQCRNPYPCDFDRGVITAISRKFHPGIKVTLDDTKPARKKGAEESWYIITY